MRVIFWMSNGFDSHFTSEHLLKAIIKALAQDGHAVHILQMKQGGPYPELPDELKLPNVTTACIPCDAPEKTNFIKRYIREIRWHMSCKAELVKHKDYDALFLQSTAAGGFAMGLARRILGRKAVITFNVQDIFPYNAVFGGKIKSGGAVCRLLAVLQRAAYRKADHIITISEDMKDTLVSDGTAPDKIEVIYNWAYQDEPYENVDLTPVSHMFKPGYFHVVYAGNIGVMQNVAILIEAAKGMKDDGDVWFHIIGDGVYKDRLEAKAKSDGITNISFYSMQPPERAPAVYAAADVNVIPLVKDGYRTALPSKTATCLACGKPVVFAIGEESKFARSVMHDTGCPAIGSEDAGELIRAIRAMKAGQLTCQTRQFFLDNMNRSANSRQYARIITRRR